MLVADKFGSLEEISMAHDVDPALRLHNKLLYTTIALDHLGPSIQHGDPEMRFRGYCKNYISAPSCRIGSAQNAYALIEILEKEGKIGIGDYDVLKDILSFDETILREIHYTELQLLEKGTHIYERIGDIKRMKTNIDYDCKYVQCNRYSES